MLIGVVLRRRSPPCCAPSGSSGIWTAWAVALVGLVFAVLSNASTWAGPATLVYGLALLAAAALGADGARARVAEQSFGWRQPVAALIAFAAAAGPLLVAAGWMIRGADGPLERRDPVQVPAFVAEESGTRDQARTLVLDSDSAAHVGYMLVRGSGARLGDAELAAADGENKHARQGRRQPRRRLRRRPGRPARRLRRALRPRPQGRAPRGQPRPGRHARPDPAQPAGRQRPVAGRPAGRARDHRPRLRRPAARRRRPRRASTPRSRPAPTAASCASPTPPTRAGRPPWTAGRSPATTVDGWAQGFELPASGGRLDVTFDDPDRATPPGCGPRARSPSSSWCSPCPAAAATSTTTSPRSPSSPPRPSRARAAGPAGCAPRPRPNRGQPTRRPEDARRPPPPEEAPAPPVPQQQTYGEWDTPTYAGAEYGTYGGEQQYQGAPQYPAGAYDQQQYQADPYQGGQYDPYAYGRHGRNAAYDQRTTRRTTPGLRPGVRPGPAAAAAARHRQ